MASLIGIILRALQFFWSLLIMALVGDMIHNSIGGNPSIVNYMMVIAVFSMLSLLYLIPASVREGFAIHGLLPVLVDGFNLLFTFAGGVALATYLGVANCADAKFVHTNFVTSGSNDDTKRCREAQASTAFIWLLFITYLASLVFDFLNRDSIGGGLGVRVGVGGIRRGPSMSQRSHA